MIPRVYIDTSVIGGCVDEEFHEHSERLFTDFEAERLQAVISNITIAEMLQAPEEVRSTLERPALQSHCHCPTSRYISELEFSTHCKVEPDSRLQFREFKIWISAVGD